MSEDFQADFGRTVSDYSTHRAGFPPLLFDKLGERGIGADGQRILDLGTGTGTLARGFAMRGGRVTGLDPSAQMIEGARALDREAGVTVDYVVAGAESTGLPAASFDIVTAGQCWHWFDSPAAFAEVARLLVPGGRLAICHYDWLPLPGNMVEATEDLIRSHNPEWPYGGGTGFHSGRATGAAIAGYRDLESFTYDLPQPYTHQAWRGRIRASAGVGGSLPEERVQAFDTALAAELSSRFPEDPLSVPHRLFALIATRPA